MLNQMKLDNRLLGIMDLKIALLIIISFILMGNIAISQDLRISLTNNSAQKEYLKGSPVFITVEIHNEDAIRAWNQRAKNIPQTILATKEGRWSNYLQFTIKKLHNRTSKTQDIENQINSSDLLELHRLYAPYSDKTEEFVFTTSAARESLLIPPEITEKMEEGTYECIVRYDPTSYPGTDTTIFKGVLASAPFTLIIKEPRTNQDKAEVLLAKSSYIASYNFGRDNRHQEALNLALQAAELAPDLPKVHLGLAVEYQALGEYEDSLREFQAYLKYLETLNLNEGKNNEVDRIKRFIRGVQAKIDAEKSK
ncbi:MAG: hypothetical protein ACE14V_14045 [bacterium]